MYRIGKVVSIDSSAQTGEIIDEHDQDILFSVVPQQTSLEVGDTVRFNIELTSEGLRAVNVKAFLQTDANPPKDLSIGI